MLAVNLKKIGAKNETICQSISTISTTHNDPATSKQSQEYYSLTRDTPLCTI